MKATCGNCRYRGKGERWTVPEWVEQDAERYECSVCYANPPEPRGRVNHRPEVDAKDLACRFWAPKASKAASKAIDLE